MYQSRYLWVAALTGVLLAIEGTNSARAAEGSFERTLKVTGPVEINVDTGSGHINVRTGDSTSVRVRGTIKSGGGRLFNDGEAENKVRYLESNPPIRQDGNFIRVGHIEDRDLIRNISISYDLVVPVEARLRAHSGSGNESVVGIRGPVDAFTGSGSLKLLDIRDEVKADTGSGDLELDSVKGNTRASTGSGSIRATALAGSFVVSTGSGDVKLEQISRGAGKVETGSGSIELRGVHGALRVHTGSGSITAEGDPTGDWRLETGSGTIRLRLPAHASFDLDAHTGSGRVSSGLPITAQVMGHGELRGRVGQGGVRLDLRTGSGNIRIE